MKYSNEIIINLPRARVIELFDSFENMKIWANCSSYEHLSGTSGQVGAKTKMEYQMGKRKVTMIETITKRDLPDEFNGTYETDGAFNIVNNRFIELDGGKTHWISESEFQFSSVMMKMMGWLMPGAFKKQSQKFMENFKKFAEEGGE